MLTDSLAEALWVALPFVQNRGVEPGFTVDVPVHMVPQGGRGRTRPRGRIRPRPRTRGRTRLRGRTRPVRRVAFMFHIRGPTAAYGGQTGRSVTHTHTHSLTLLTHSSSLTHTCSRRKQDELLFTSITRHCFPLNGIYLQARLFTA